MDGGHLLVIGGVPQRRFKFQKKEAEIAGSGGFYIMGGGGVEFRIAEQNSLFQSKCEMMVLSILSTTDLKATLIPPDYP
jgi:hypothetical protein